MYLSGRIEVYECSRCARVVLHGYGGPKRPGAEDVGAADEGITIVDHAGRVISIDGLVRVIEGECATCAWDVSRETSGGDRVADDPKDVTG